MYTNAESATMNNTRTIVISTDNKASDAQNLLTLFDNLLIILTLLQMACEYLVHK
jgi:hypothetical protein